MPQKPSLFALLDRPLKEFCAACTSTLEGLQTYAVLRAGQFPQDAALKDCVWFRGRRAQVHVAFRWRAAVAPKYSFTILDALKLLVGHVSIHVTRTVIEFETWHDFSGEGLTAVRRRRWLARFARAMAKLLLVIGTFLSVVFTAVLIAELKADVVNTAQMLTAGWMLAAGLALLALAGACVAASRRLGIPETLRTIGQLPFELEGIRTVEQCNRA